MDKSKIDIHWPNALRWFLVQELSSFTPWHFIKEPSEMEGTAKVFKREDISKGEVFVFARRQDCDDFAGLEIVDGEFTNKVIYFHPVFASGITNESSPRTWNIVRGVFDDVFEFVSKQVIPDMKDWALEEDASDL
jgi:hypothetical protein